jgi:hypothetical protein
VHLARRGACLHDAKLAIQHQVKRECPVQQR